MSGPSNASTVFEKMRRIPFAIWSLAIVGVCGGVGYGIHHGQYQRQRPEPRIARIVEGLDRYQREHPTLPRTITKLSEVLPGEPWKQAGSQSAVLRNYLYTYHLIDPYHATLWATPIGKYRDEGATYLLVIRKNDYEIWKGRPLSPRDTEALTAEAIPTFAQLSMYGLERVYQSTAATPSQSGTTTQGRSR
jgi:hypothetical protein